MAALQRRAATTGVGARGVLRDATVREVGFAQYLMYQYLRTVGYIVVYLSQSVAISGYNMDRNLLDDGAIVREVGIITFDLWKIFKQRILSAFSVHMLDYERC